MNNGQMIADFLTAHPGFEATHVVEIAEFAESESIPYCVSCHDWHHPSEEHSS
jgi:hypothetical protein